MPPDPGQLRRISSLNTAHRRAEPPAPPPLPPATPFLPPSGPAQWLFQGPHRQSDFLAADEVLGRSGFSVYEGICSKRCADGSPERLWDRKTGAVNPRVAADWRSHDNAYQLIHRWNELKEKLSGRLYVSVGESDEVGLAGPVALLQKDLAAMGADVTVRIGPGGHFWSEPGVSPQARQPGMFDRFREWRDREQAGKPSR
jgi:hypothetical protein